MVLGGAAGRGVGRVRFRLHDVGSGRVVTMEGGARLGVPRATGPTAAAGLRESGSGRRNSGVLGQSGLAAGEGTGNGKARRGPFGARGAGPSPGRDGLRTGRITIAGRAGCRLL